MLLTYISRLITVFKMYGEHKKWCEWNESHGYPCNCKGFLFSILGNVFDITDNCCDCPWTEFIY